MQINGKVDGQDVNFIQTTANTWETVVPKQDSYTVEITVISDTGNITYATKYLTSTTQATTVAKLIYAGEINSSTISLKSNSKLLLQELMLCNKTNVDTNMNVQIDNIYLLKNIHICANDTLILKLFTVVNSDVSLTITVDRLNSIDVIISGTEVIDI